MSSHRPQPFLARAVRDRGGLVLERCFDPTPANRIALAEDGPVREGDYWVAESAGPAAWPVERLAEGGTALAKV